VPRPAAAHVISPEQLSAALQRLDPRDWEVLDLSLRRRVPDEALARLFDTEPPDVARRRAFAIEHLADELGVQRGEDLGAVLKALLEPDTWVEAERAQEGEGWQGFPDPTAPAAPEEPPAPEPAPEQPVADEEEGGEAPADEDAIREVPAEERPAEELKTSETARHFRLAPPPELPPLDLERNPPLTATAPTAGEELAADEQPPDEATRPTPGKAQLEPVVEPTDGAAPPQPVIEAPEVVEPGEPPPNGAEPAAQPAAEAAAEPAAEPDAEVAGKEPAARPAAEEPAAEPAAEEPAAEPAAEAVGEESAVAPTNGTLPGPPEPVLDMLVERDQEERRQRIRTPLLWALAGGLGAAGLFAAGYVGANWFGDEEVQRPPVGGGDVDTRRFVPRSVGPLAEPFPSDPRDASCYPTAAVSRDVTLHARPGSRRKLKIPARTEWGSPRVLSVVRRRGDWLAVLAPELKNGEVGWMRSAGARLDCVRWSLHVDLSRRRLYVRKGGRTMRKLTIAVGNRQHPTPKGRFAVTDKLKVVDKGSPYGCCVLALTGHQTRLPPDWPGGDRLAVHATSDLSSIGKAVSLGCMRSQPKQVDWLIRTVPLGAPIFIRA
jgi:hypothetical protein